MNKRNDKTLTIVKFHCSLCGWRLGVTRKADESYELKGMGFAGQYLPVNQCPGCKTEFSQAGLEFRWGFNRDDAEVDLLF